MGSQPLYERIREQIAARIADGTYAPGAKLPSEATFADTLRVNRLTVRRAIEELARAGLVEPRQGSGTYVTTPAERVLLLVSTAGSSKIGGITQQLRDMGRMCEHKFLRASSLDVRSGDAPPDLPRGRHWRIESALNVDGAPWLWSTSWFPRSLVDEPAREWDSAVGTTGLVDSVVGGITPIWRRLSADVSSPQDSDLLGIRVTYPVLVVNQLDANAAGQPILQQSRRIRMDRIGYVLRLDET